MLAQFGNRLRLINVHLFSRRSDPDALKKLQILCGYIWMTNRDICDRLCIKRCQGRQFTQAVDLDNACDLSLQSNSFSNDTLTACYGAMQASLFLIQKPIWICPLSNGAVKQTLGQA